jgi:class 3 adenylate cyclase
VEKFIGDAVVAVFGAPAVHEDDALRAVRAADELRDLVGTLNAELDPDYRVSLELRIGVNTGQVITGASQIATEDAMNVAARLEQAAQQGEILIGGQTLQLVRGAVEVERVDALIAEGEGATRCGSQVVARGCGRTAFVRRLDTPLVGRRAKHAQIRTVFEDAVSWLDCAESGLIRNRNE